MIGMKIMGKKCGMHFRVKLDVRRGGKTKGMIRKLYFTHFKCKVPIEYALGKIQKAG